MSSPDNILEDAFDLHMHPAPDRVPRSQTMASVARQAAAAGMAGIVIKSHIGDTTLACRVLEEALQPRCRILGAITLNHMAGGISPESVGQALDLGAAIVWFPTVSARHHLGIWGRHPAYIKDPGFAGISVIGSGGRITAEAREVVSLIAERKAILATGHLSPRESLLLLETARTAGVEHLIMTHVSEEVTAMPLDEQEEAIALGALVEHCFMGATACCPGHVALSEIARQIDQVGADHVLLTSDFGQVENGPIVAGFAAWIGRLRDIGVAPAAIDQMIRENPRRLLAARLARKDA